jgi:hypothetical protein
MKVLYRWVAVIAGLAIPAATGALVSSCGSDDANSNPGPDSGGGDATVDAAPDAQTREGGPDVTPDSAPTPDATVDGGVEAASGDADAATPGTDGDANPTSDADAGQAPDAEAGTGTSASDASDAAADVTEAAAMEAAVDAGPDVVDNSALYAFPAQVGDALCNQTANCCFPDASTSFNFPLCEPTYIQTGFQGSNYGSPFLDGGNVAFDPVKAKACLNDIASIDCRTNQLTSADMAALYADCFGAMTGKLTGGSVCQDSIECAPGFFCDAVDGGTPKTCQPVRTAGASCGDFGSPAFPSGSLSALAQSTCSNRGSGNTGLACQFYTPVTFAQPDGGWFCQPAAGDGTPCTQNLNCTSKLCGGKPLACTQAAVFSPPGTCKALTKPDGG